MVCVLILYPNPICQGWDFFVDFLNKRLNSGHLLFHTNDYRAH